MVQAADVDVHDFQCIVEGRERQHDPMIFKWTHRELLSSPPPQRGPTSQSRSPENETCSPDTMADRHSMDDEVVCEAFVGRSQGMSSDSLCAIGYAFARSATMLPMFQTLGASLECAWRKPLAGTCSREEREHLAHAFRVFLTKRDPGALRSLQRNEQEGVRDENRRGADAGVGHYTRKTTPGRAR